MAKNSLDRESELLEPTYLLFSVRNANRLRPALRQVGISAQLTEYGEPASQP